jgi:hypothetical protein
MAVGEFRTWIWALKEPGIDDFESKVKGRRGLSFGPTVGDCLLWDAMRAA